MKNVAALALLLTAAGCTGDDLGDVLPGAWTPVTSDGTPTVVFGDRGDVFFPNEASGSSLGPGILLRYEVGADGHLDIVGENARGETVTEMPGLVRRISADQIEMCLPDETMARPVTFGGPECVLLGRAGRPSAPLAGRLRSEKSGPARVPDPEEPMELDIAIEETPRSRSMQPVEERMESVPHGDIEYGDVYGPASGGLPRGGGDWLVVLGSFGQPNDPGIGQLLNRLGSAPVPVYVEASSTIPKFRPGLTVVVAGPYRTQAEARRQEQALKRIVPDAYRKEGW